MGKWVSYMSRAKSSEVSFSFLVDKPVHELRPGDLVRLRNGKAGKIVDSFCVHGRRVFVTDQFGRIFDYELSEVK
ncbi:hypothetical protein SAMN05444955_1373 [Lihuaxuella thermophila]|uniref:Uncharacterized protein n=1 Tax=Lihuaxuella thermophila TaxID=1173111 RepID=A0A1H8JQP3_9BACL|nr:hypothetical protein SAMN05444955_1373 [Lihuaxuella thermophila]